MEKTYRMLAEWGCDIDTARERFMLDDDLYENCLKIFAEDSNFVALDSYIKNSMYQQAFECAHTLKGVAGNLGLTPIYRVTSDIVEDLRKTKYDRLQNLYKILVQEYEQLQHILTVCV